MCCHGLLPVHCFSNSSSSVMCLQRISYAKRDSEIIAKMKGTYSAAGRTAKRKEGDDADAQAKRKRKPVAK